MLVASGSGGRVSRVGRSRTGLSGARAARAETHQGFRPGQIGLKRDAPYRSCEPGRTGRTRGAAESLLTWSDMSCPSRWTRPPQVSYGAGMPIQAGRHHLGPEHGQIVLRTFRDGLAAQAGHDLTIEISRWSGELSVGDDLAPTSLEVRIDMGSLVVREGTGGLKPLSDRDKREIAVTARKVLAADRNPEATFSATDFTAAAGGGEISGTLNLAGRSRPIRLRVSESGSGYQAATSVVQTEFGIKPYSGFLGALKVRDAVEVRAEIALPDGGETA